MNRASFLAFAWAALGLELGLRDALALGPGGAAPSFLLALAGFIALWAPPTTLALSCLFLGALADLIRLYPLKAGHDVVILGPHALGFLLAGITILNFRALLFRKNPFSVAVVFTIGGAVAAVLASGLLAARAALDQQVVLAPGQSMLLGLASALYTGLLVFLLSPVQRVLISLLGFREASRGRDSWMN